MTGPAPRSTDSEFSGRGGLYPPSPSELSAAEEARLERAVDPDPPGLDNVAAQRLQAERDGLATDRALQKNARGNI